MKLKRWIDKRPIDMWVKDSNGRPIKLIYGARCELKFPPIEGDFYIETRTVSVEWIKQNFRD